MAIKIGDAVLEIGGDTTKLKRSLDGIGKKMTQVGKNLTMKLTAPLAAFGALSIKTAADFSKAMAKVNAVTGATAEQFEELNDVAKELGRTTQFTATQVAEAMSFMGMAGMDTNEILSAIPDTLNLAAAGALDMGAAANIVTNILAGFGMRTDQLGSAVDVLAKAFTSSNTDLLMLGESMKFAGPVAKGFGLTFEETAAIMGIFGNAGIQASLAGTSLRGAIVQLDKKAADFGITMNDATGKMLPMADILEQLEKKGFTASEMMELFGLRAGPAMTALLEEGSDALRAFTLELENAGGTAEMIAEVQMEGLHGTLIRLKSAFEGLQLAIAEEVTPGFESLVDKLAESFRWFVDLPGPIKSTAIALGLLLMVVGPLVWMSGSLVINFAALKGSFIGAAVGGAAVNAVLSIMLGLSVSVGAAIIILVASLAALALGIGMVVFGLIQLNKNAMMRKAETRLIEEQEKAVRGLANEYRLAAEEAEALGFTVSDAMWREIELTELVKQAALDRWLAVRGMENQYREVIARLVEMGAAVDDDTLKWAALMDVVDALYDEMAKGGEANLDLIVEQIAAIEDMGQAIDQEVLAWIEKQHAVNEVNLALDKQIALQQQLAAGTKGLTEKVAGGFISQSLMGLLQAMKGLNIAGQPVSPEEAAKLVDLYQGRIDAEKSGVRQYKHGGDILGPTALTSLRTGQTYAIAGEAGPESVVPDGRGGMIEHLPIDILGERVLDIFGRNLVAKVRLQTGLQY